MKIKVDGQEYEVDIEEVDGKIKIKYDGEEHLVEINEEREHIDTGNEVQRSEASSTVKPVSGGSEEPENKIEFCEKIIKAPMPGTINTIFVKEGNSVEKGDVLITLIAMKMENKIIANNSGIVKEIQVNVNDNVEAEQILIVLE